MRKVVVFFLLPMLILSLSLALFGIDHIGFSNSFYNLFRSLSNQTVVVKIPQIPLLQVGSNVGGTFRDVLVVIVDFFNFIINLINVLVQLVNVLIQLLMCIFNFIRTVILWRDSLVV